VKLKYSIIILLLAAVNVLGQGKTYTFDLFTVKIENNYLHVYDKSKNKVFEKKFTNPTDFSFDLDEDGVEEYVVIDNSKDKDRDIYSFYVFNTIDSFYVADSIYSGYFEPFTMKSDETGKTIIVTGNSKFDLLNSEDSILFIPINCWEYENGNIIPVNNKVYKPFVDENDTLLDIIDSYFSSSGSDCKSIEKIKGAIASVYANYTNAGDKLLAIQFLKRYYHCTDIVKFKEYLDKLLL
jgi:hypothetical protein